MSTYRLNSNGTNFTVAGWNANCDDVEAIGTYLSGYCVAAGLQLSNGGGLTVNISAGVQVGLTVNVLLNPIVYQAPSNGTYWLWCDENGNITPTTSYIYPGGPRCCLGQITTTGTGITAINTQGRQELVQPLYQVRQGGGYSTFAVAGGTLLVPFPLYGDRILEFTGALTSNQIVQLPPSAGDEWTVVNSTTGAFTLQFQSTAQTLANITVAQGKTAKIWCDGANVRRSTPDV